MLLEFQRGHFTRLDTGSIKKVTGRKILNKVSLTLCSVPDSGLEFQRCKIRAPLNVLKNKNAVTIYFVIIFKQTKNHIYFPQLVIKIHANRLSNYLFKA